MAALDSVINCIFYFLCYGFLRVTHSRVLYFFTHRPIGFFGYSITGRTVLSAGLPSIIFCS